MWQAYLVRRPVVVAVLVGQFVPLLLFPPESFSANRQEWWLPALLAALVLLADLALLVRHSLQIWPWHLLLFAHGFNIISRLMMIWSHATKMVGGIAVADGPYLLATLIAMAGSAALLWYWELPGVRMSVFRPSALH